MTQADSRGEEHVHRLPPLPARRVDITTGRWAPSAGGPGAPAAADPDPAEDEVHEEHEDPDDQ